jgi:hypothetical protein
MKPIRDMSILELVAYYGRLENALCATCDSNEERKLIKIQIEILSEATERDRVISDLPRQARQALIGV